MSSNLSVSLEGGNSQMESSNLSVSCVCSCGYQGEYRRVYGQLSALRMELRALKGEVVALRGTNKGLTDENGLLKQFLGKKKEMVQGLTTRLLHKQTQIQRLQQEIRDAGEQKDNYQQQAGQSEKQLREVHRRMEMAQFQLGESRVRCERLQEQVGRFSKEREEEWRRVSDLMGSSFRLTSQGSKKSTRVSSSQFVNKKQSSPKLNTKQSMLQRLQKYEAKQEILSISQSQKGSPKRKELLEKSGDKFQDGGIIQLVQNLRQKQHTLSLMLQSKEKECQQMRLKYEQDEQKLGLALSKLEEGDVQYRELSGRLQQKQEQLKDIQVKVECLGERHEVQLWVIDRLMTAVKVSVPQSAQIVTKMMDLLHLNPLPTAQQNTPPSSLAKPSSLKTQRVQYEYLTKQLLSLSSCHTSQTLRHSIESRRADSLLRECEEWRQRYGCLQLKLKVLEGQYGEVLQDNKRLIRFGGLSAYRVDRNGGTGRRAQLVGKENQGNVSNTTISVKK